MCTRSGESYCPLYAHVYLKWRVILFPLGACVFEVTGCSSFCYAVSFFTNASSVFYLFRGVRELYLILYGVKCWNDSMNTTWEGCERYHLWRNLRYYPGIFLEGMRKTTKTSIGIVIQPKFEPDSPGIQVGKCELTCTMHRKEDNFCVTNLVSFRWIRH